MVTVAHVFPATPLPVDIIRNPDTLSFEVYAAHDRRAGLRAPLKGPVVMAAAGRQLDVLPVDVSPTGIAVATEQPPPRGTHLRLGFAIPSDDDGPPRWVEADGIVARTAARDHDNVVGVEFLVIEGHAAADIQRYVRSTLSPRRRTGEYAPISVYPPPKRQD
jgi:hypothetical protein